MIPFRTTHPYYMRAHVKIGQFPFVCKQSSFLKKWWEMFWFRRESEKSGSRKSESKTIYDTLKNKNETESCSWEKITFYVSLFVYWSLSEKKNVLSSELLIKADDLSLTQFLFFVRFAISESTLKVYLRGAHGGCTQLSSLRRVHSVHHHRYAKC